MGIGNFQNDFHLIKSWIHIENKENVFRTIVNEYGKEIAVRGSLDIICGGFRLLNDHIRCDFLQLLHIVYYGTYMFFPINLLLTM